MTKNEKALELIMEYNTVSYDVAKGYLRLMSEEQIMALKEDNVFSLPFNEIEMLFFFFEIMKEIVILDTEKQIEIFKNQFYNVVSSDIKKIVSQKMKKFIEPAKRDNSMNIRIPLVVSAKGMNNSHKSVMNDIRGSKVFIGRFRNLINSKIFTMNIMELIFEDIINSRSKFRKKSSVIEEEFSALFRNSEKDMSVRAFDNIFGNFLSPSSRIFETA